MRYNRDMEGRSEVAQMKRKERMMISLEKFAESWTWNQRRDSVESADYDSGDIDTLGFSILNKRNGKFFIKAYRVGGGEERLQYAEFDTVEDAKNHCIKLMYTRMIEANKAGSLIKW